MTQSYQKFLAKDKIVVKPNTWIDNMIQALLHTREKLFGLSTEAAKQIKRGKKASSE